MAATAQPATDRRSARMPKDTVICDPPRPVYALSGCRPVPMSEPEVAAYEGRLEYWDADDGFAWQVEEVSARHEGPVNRLAWLVRTIGMMRGKPLALYGSTDLQRRDANDARLRVAQADQIIYLDRPENGPEDGPDPVIVVGRTPLPDVVVEVDLTTDIRERKLDLYAEWKIPELWVEVPDAPMRSKRKRPGLTIHVLDKGKFREASESTAFPTWTAREIHAAVNERELSEATVDTLRRVGEIMGRESGTGPDDDPVLSAHGDLKREEGRKQGRKQGKEEGRQAGVIDERLSTVERLLAMRNIPTTGLRDEAERIAALPRETVLQAALQCTDLADFRTMTAAGKFS